MTSTLDSLSDRELLAEFSRSSADEVFTVLFDRYRSMVLRVCHRVLKSWDEAEDAAQLVFLVLSQQPADKAWDERIEGWLYTVAYNTAHNRLRNRWLALPLEEEPEDLSGVFASEYSYQTEALLEAIARLPERQREAVCLCHLEDLSREQAASEMDCTLGALNGLLNRAFKSLRRSREWGNFILGGSDTFRCRGGEEEQVAIVISEGTGKEADEVAMQKLKEELELSNNKLKVLIGSLNEQLPADAQLQYKDVVDLRIAGNTVSDISRALRIDEQIVRQALARFCGKLMET